MLRSAAMPSPIRKISMTNTTIRSTSTGGVGPLPVRTCPPAFSVLSLRLIKD